MSLAHVEHLLKIEGEKRAVYGTVIITRQEWEANKGDLGALLKAKAENAAASVLDAAKEMWG